MNKPPISVPAENRPTNAELWLRKNFPTNVRNGKQIVVMEFDGHDEKFDYFVYQDFNGKRWEMADILEAYAASSSLLPVPKFEVAVGPCPGRTDTGKYTTITYAIRDERDEFEVRQRTTDDAAGYEKAFKRIQQICQASLPVGRQLENQSQAICPECGAKSQLTLTATGPWIHIVCGACKQWWSIGEIEHTPYFFGGKPAPNGPNKVAKCGVEGCTNPARWQSKCEFHLNNASVASLPVGESTREPHEKDCAI